MGEIVKTPTDHDMRTVVLDRPGLCVLDLPLELRTSDSRLRASAARLLEMESVRSVSIDGRRTKASIRLRSMRAAPLDPATMSAQLSAELASEEELSTPAELVICWTDPRTQTLCFIKPPTQAVGWRRVTLLIGAAVFLMFGLLGVVLPGLPTTPFVLLASYCLLRSSPALHQRLLASRLFGGVLRDWHLYRGIRPHVRYKALAIIAIVVGVSLYFANLSTGAMLAIVAIAACGIAYVWRLPSVVE